MNLSKLQDIFTIPNAAARWGCSIADIGAWAARGRLRIVTGISPVMCAGRETAGLVEVSVADILPLFLKGGRENAMAYLKRVRPVEDDEDWRTIIDPAEGIVIVLADLAIQGHEVAQFEAEEGLVMVRAGGAQRYDWEKMAYGLVVRAARERAPKSQSELGRWALDWFADHGDVPDESTARRRLMPLWREFQGQG